MVQFVECPRDAMQGWSRFIETEQKLRYLQQLLKVGFHTLDCGSFVSPKAIPQMADTAQVLNGLDLTGTTSKLLTIVANVKGADDAAAFPQISYMGYPFSISETFQKRNTNAGIKESFERVKLIQERCLASGKELVIYISMGFGNPYGDPYNASIVNEWIEELGKLGIGIFSLADTVGLADRQLVHKVSKAAVQAFPNFTIGVHLHASPNSIVSKLQAAIDAGVIRFDGAMKGIGGCPMANDELVGNMDTEVMIPLLQSQGLLSGLNQAALEEAGIMAGQIFQH
ncbi:MULTISPECIES: hydroxymethylglutaryl-CoA lyase [unclassified Paraflavitalea]|uniref:hydroxymethylglutaryl-CoA lyase n=1 Tax=unclassified Paraflavitalea TaxID=2798305 RepID=UPI003D3430B9